MSERRAASHTVAAILLLRRFAERESRRQLEGVRAQLEMGRQRERLLAEQLRMAEQACHLRATKARGGGTVPAQQLASEQATLRLLRNNARRAEAELAEATAQMQSGAGTLELARSHLLLSIARREAAELHEASERRDRARYRQRRASQLEEELAGRQVVRARRLDA